MLQDLRDLAGFLERHPEAPLPFLDSLNAFCDRDEARAAVLIPGPWAKSYTGQFFNLARQFGSISYEVTVPREQVCERRVVGKRVIPEREVEVVEWDCADPILAPPEQDREAS